MSEAINVDPGVCVAFGGTNARFANCYNGDIQGYEPQDTPTHPDEFFKWTARQALDAAYDGKKWMVAGFPGPVEDDGQTIGPMANVEGMRDQVYDLQASLKEVDPAIADLLDGDFTLVAVNDGVLAAQAAAGRVGDNKAERTAAIINGTGSGAGMVIKDNDYPNVHRAVTDDPLELGHLDMFLGKGSIEERISSNAFLSKGLDPKHTPSSDPRWPRVGEGLAIMATIMGLVKGATLVVPTGGIGGGGSAKYKGHMRRALENFKDSGGNGIETRRKYTPDIAFMDPGECDEFELYGAEAFMRSFLSPNK